MFLASQQIDAVPRARKVPQVDAQVLLSATILLVNVYALPFIMTCHLRNGTKSPKAVPCDHDAVLQGRHTACCNPTDLCLSNGLCRSPVVNNLTNYAWFWGCTDETFTDAACGNYCDKFKTENHQLVFQCPDPDTWCCHKGAAMPDAERINRTNTVCCSASDQLFKAPWPTIVATASFSGTPVAVMTLTTGTLNGSLISTTTGSLTTAGSIISSTPEATTPALAIGLGTGLGGGAVFAIAFGWIFLRRRNQRIAEAELMVPTSDNKVEIMGQVVSEKDVWDLLVEKDGKERCELESTGTTMEVEGNTYVVELAAVPAVCNQRNQGEHLVLGAHSRAREGELPCAACADS